MSDPTRTTNVATVRPIAELFRPDVSALWATTYNLDLALFNEYLLGRLGDPPLNAVVLADQERVDASLAAVPPERIDVLYPVNRRWLLRGFRVGSGRFHPKSYLSVDARSAKLLVGSGNLSTNGIDQGREVFTTFATGTEYGDAAIGTWRAWMRRLVEASDDSVLAERFTDLEERLPSQPAAHLRGASPLWHNLDRPFADQFVDALFEQTDRLDELIVTAPYYDEAGDALTKLIQRLNPATLRVYFSSSTNVDGVKLVNRLTEMGVRTETFAYVPDRFNHAKLIGAVAGDAGWLLSGSANLSHAALSLMAGTGNVELAIFSEMSAEVARSCFVPPDVTVEEHPLAALADLRFESKPDDDGAPTVTRLRRSTRVTDGRVEILTDTPVDPSWLLADHDSAQPLVVADQEAATLGELAGPLVRLVDRDGVTLSNCMVVDDLVALNRILRVEESSGDARPAELTEADLDTPLGRALVFLHRKVVMDVSEGEGRGAVGNATRADTAGEIEDDDLWNRLEREKLARDPRAGTYDKLLGRSAVDDGALAEPLIELLEAMRDRAPSDLGSRSSGSLLRVLTREGAAGVKWSTATRIRVRARNVLRRWAAAQTDPRLCWVDPYAPLGNLVLVAAVFAGLWQQSATGDAVELTADDLQDLWSAWFRPFVGSSRGDGWLDHEDLNDAILSNRLTDDFARCATALCWLAIKPGPDRRRRIVAWQPYLRAAFQRNLIRTDADTSEYLRSTGHLIDLAQIDADIVEAIDFIDDDLWCEQQRATLGLEELGLEATSEGQATSVRLNVRGIDDPLYDPRVAALVVAVRQYRSTDAVAIFGSDHDWRVVVSTGDPIAFKADVAAPLLESDPLKAGTIEDIAAGQGVLADLFPAEIRVA